MTEKNLVKHCIECHEEITEHSKQVFTDIEAKADAFFNNHEKKLDAQEIKQTERFDKLESKLIGMVKWVLGIVLFVVSICSGIVALSFIQIQNKADKTEVLSLKDAKNLVELGRKYNDDRYVINPNQTVDQYNYMWFVETIFERASRSGKEIKPN